MAPFPLACQALYRRGRRDWEWLRHPTWYRRPCPLTVTYSHLPTLLIRALSRVLSPTDLRQRPGLPSERRASDAPRIIETFQNDQAQLLTTCSMLGRGESSREACGRGVPGVGGLQQGQGGFDRSSLRPMTLFP